MHLEKWLKENTPAIVSEFTLGNGKPYRVCQPRPRILLASGASLSVQVGDSLYSKTNEDGKTTHVEVGFPQFLCSECEELLEKYQDSCDRPLEESVFGYVPTPIVDAIIEIEGGIVTPNTKKYWVAGNELYDYRIIRMSYKTSTGARFIIFDGPYDTAGEAAEAADRLVERDAQEELADRALFDLEPGEEIAPWER